MFTRFNAACSVMLGLTLPRVGKVARSKAITTKRRNAIPYLHTFVERTRAPEGGLQITCHDLLPGARAVPKIHVYTRRDKCGINFGITHG